MSLREVARTIWQAGVDAVDSARLVASQIECANSILSIGEVDWSPGQGGRICVVGAGKAGAGMARGFENALSANLLELTTGWVNVPDDCVQPLQKIHLHGGRPPGVNEPTAAGVAGTQEILKLVGTLTSEDLCVVLISGGGSALLPAPIEGISLDDKLHVTQTLMQNGVPIEDLNCVRRSLSAVKGGGLLRACRAGTVVALIISDVIGNPLETIASGPTVNMPHDNDRSLSILRDVASRSSANFSEAVWKALEESSAVGSKPSSAPDCLNLIIGENATAVNAAIAAAKELGYEIARSAHDETGIARDLGVALAQEALTLRTGLASGARWCVITGGEPLVHLAPTDAPRKGGRNQELVLAATTELWNKDMSGITILSGGTDGEDGPTDAAGAMIDDKLIRAARQKSLTPAPFLEVNNAYPFLEQINGLLKTGPTHTNVMDLRIVLIEATN